MTKLNLAQKLSVSATLLAVAVFLFAGGCQTTNWQDRWGDSKCMDGGRTIAVSIGILLVGGVVTFLLGLIPVRMSGTPVDASRLPPGK